MKERGGGVRQTQKQNRIKVQRVGTLPNDHLFGVFFFFTGSGVTLAGIRDDVICDASNLRNVRIFRVTVVDEDLDITVAPPTLENVHGGLVQPGVVPAQEQASGVSVILLDRR